MSLCWEFIQHVICFVSSKQVLRGIGRSSLLAWVECICHCFQSVAFVTAFCWPSFQRLVLSCHSSNMKFAKVFNYET